jgi:hypothetical protein
MEPSLPRVNKQAQRRWAADLFAALAIEGHPIGAEALQEMSQCSGLEPDELSRGLIDARGE